MYSIDTSALVNGWVRYYPPAVFHSLWDQIDGLVIAGDLVASRSVYEEIKRQDDDLSDWAEGHDGLFVEDDEEVQQRVRRIFADWPRPVDFTRYLTGADPFVIGLAQCRGLSVVTGEKPSNNPDAPKIPDACNHYGVSCIDLLGMIQARGWQF